MKCIGKILYMYNKYDLFRHSLAFVYGHILEKELNEFRISWNSHRMRKNKNIMCPAGVPDDIFYLHENSEHSFKAW